MTDKPKVVGKPFAKGQSGNLNGRPAIPPEVKEAAKAHTLLAIETLVDVMKNGKNEASRVNSAVAMLNRGWGAPTQQVDVEHTHKQDWSALLSALDAHNVAKTLTRSEAPVIEGNVIEAELVKDIED
ncbi:hypothetical protein [Rhizobium sp. L43]|uniref:hypothetical protein n=1 Tax=Rhizobium sp. L43 TaxID=2035452 RepID=UPI000BE8EA13|nr:hypothetical protein [Rhizobium sp. L43]PDS75447.1 hypothetical protein CO667_26560 [Rhizobium sp. L43]